VKTDTGIALRSTVFPLELIPKLAPELDGRFSMAWYPSIGSRADAIEMCALSLNATRSLMAGTGVIRLAEYDLGRLVVRADGLARASKDRFVLGVGTGHMRGAGAVDQLVTLAGKLRKVGLGGSIPLYFAALGPRMVRAAFEHADGVLLNFCSPGYASRVTSRAGKKRDGFRVTCYVKLFFAEDDGEARRMLANEFANYDAIPQYHDMFDSMGLTKTLAAFKVRQTVQEGDITPEIAQISLANPTRDQTLDLLGRFREAGVDSPVVYPYVEGSEQYKFEVARRLRDWTS
jgi:alkanesulfonate monooxygenase SsuD/methylene tetrahydromethanopterin reductase-like flavin-dependent oxidoreductase (luciferase family)